jgi:putative protease
MKEQDKVSLMEIMAPVGSYESLMAAIKAGAQSVYFGVGKMNMRSRSAANFALDDLRKIAAICHPENVRMYLTLNTIIFDQELEEMRSTVDVACESGITAVIASDISVMEYCRKKGMEVHTSTQCNITNTEAVSFYAQYADVMVLARELTLDQVAEIARNIKARNITGPSGKQVLLEVFIHGALCMAVSGKCYLSLDLFNQSANRGACFQPCRRGYHVTDIESEIELNIDHEYIMSPKDLCTIGFLDKIQAAGVSILKIEGRGRSADYVLVTTQCYREAVEALQEGSFTRERVEGWETRLKSVYNRGFWEGYYLGRTLGEWTATYGSQATSTKLFIGRVTNYFSNLGVAEIHIDTYDLRTGDELQITGPTTGVVQHLVTEVRVADAVVETAVKGEDCSVALQEIVRRGDKVYKIVAGTK